MIYFTIFNGLVFDGFPFWVEISIVEVDYGLTDQFVTKEHIVVIAFNLDLVRSWKLCTELKTLKELWIRLIDLVVVSCRKLFLTIPNNDVWVRESNYVPGCEFKAI